MLTRKKWSLLFLLFYLFLLVYICTWETFLYFFTPATFPSETKNNLQYTQVQINTGKTLEKRIKNRRTADDSAQNIQENIGIVEKFNEIQYAVDKNGDKFKRQDKNNNNNIMKSNLHLQRYIRHQSRKSRKSSRNNKISHNKINSFPVYDKKVQTLYPPAWTIVDLRIRYIMNIDACAKTGGGENKGENKGKNYVINLVHSKANHVTLRQTIRKAFPASELENLFIRRIFLLAKPQILIDDQNDTKLIYKNSTTLNDYINGEDSKNDYDNDNGAEIDINKIERLRQKQLENMTEEGVTMRRLEEEQNEFGDLVMGDFMESYRNLTYKHLMGLEWVTRYCAGAQYILKQDDDVIVETEQLKNLRPLVKKAVDQYKKNVSLQLGMDVHSERANQHFNNLKYFVGIVFKLSKPVRDQASYEKGKWFVTHEEFAGKFYPNYVSGWSYVTTVDVARDILKVSRKSTFFWIDDVYVSGILRKAVGNSSIKTIQMDSSLLPTDLWIAERPQNGLLYT